MPQPVVQVDAFTDRPFAGNPAAVCILESARDAEWMQTVALEMNLSETAFLVPAADGYGLRWFTPEVEIDLCGHATLASAHVLWQDGHLAPDAEARFQTRSGLLTCRRDGDWIWMDFPAKPSEPAGEMPELADALGVRALHVGRSHFDHVVEVESADVVRSLRPDISRIATFPVRGVIVTARGDEGSGYDFVSRFFAPAAGVAEDPVTGSAHCVLAPYWAAKLGRAELTGFQASKRGGVVRVRHAGDRVHLGGQAVTVMRGELLD